MKQIKKIEYRGNLSRVSPQQDATQKIAESLRVRELPDYMYHLSRYHGGYLG